MRLPCARSDRLGDANHTGDALYAAAGCLFRLKLARVIDGAALRVANLNPMRFEPVATPPEATRWARP